MESYDLIIIGAGPAGITAGIYATRKSIKTLLLTKDFVGQVGTTSEIKNWPGEISISGIELMKKLQNHLKEHQIDIKENEEVAKVEKNEQGFIIKTKTQEFSAKSVIIATGRSPRKLGITGEKEFSGKGVSYCVICDGPLFKDGRVAVIGGGNAGFEAALELSKYTKQVFLIEREKDVLADNVLQEKAREAGNIEIHTNKEAEQVQGNVMVEKLVCHDRETNEKIEFAVSGIFIEIGGVPAGEYLKDIVEFNEIGEVKVNSETCETSSPGLFAAGDINSKKWNQIITAAADGARAALAVYEFLNK